MAEDGGTRLGFHLYRRHVVAHAFTRSAIKCACRFHSSVSAQGDALLAIRPNLTSRAVHIALNRRRSDRTFPPVYFPPSYVGSGQTRTLALSPKTRRPGCQA